MKLYVKKKKVSGFGGFGLASNSNSLQQDPPSLYYTTASEYSCTDGEVTITPCCEANQMCNAVIIASEPLTYSRRCWKLVPKNHMLTVTQENKLILEPITVEDQCQSFENWKKQSMTN